MIIDRVYVLFWLGLSPLAVLSFMMLIQDGITLHSLMLSILFGLPQFIILSLLPISQWFDNKRNKLLTT